MVEEIPHDHADDSVRYHLRAFIPGEFAFCLCGAGGSKGLLWDLFRRFVGLSVCLGMRCRWACFVCSEGSDLNRIK